MERRHRFPLDNEFYDRLFAGAMRRAETILLGPSADTSIVFAEQIFGGNEILSDEGIRGRFKEWKWPDLRGRKSIVKFLDEVEVWLVRHLEQREETLENLHGPTSTAETRFIRALFGFCGRHTGEVMYGPWPSAIEALAQRFPSLVEEWCGMQRFAAEDRSATSSDNAWHEELARWCLADRNPEDPDQPKEFPTTKHYRPWSLFRYIRTCRSRVSGIDKLRNRLQATRKQLSTGLTPNDLLDTYSYDFPEFNQMFENRETEP